MVTMNPCCQRLSLGRRQGSVGLIKPNYHRGLKLREVDVPAQGTQRISHGIRVRSQGSRLAAQCWFFYTVIPRSRETPGRSVLSQLGFGRKQGIFPAPWCREGRRDVTRSKESSLTLPLVPPRQTRDVTSVPVCGCRGPTSHPRLCTALGARSV